MNGRPEGKEKEWTDCGVENRRVFDITGNWSSAALDPRVGIVVVVVDSHIQRIVLATEETTVTQQVSHSTAC